LNTRSEIIDAIVSAYRCQVEKDEAREFINVDDGGVILEDPKEYESFIRATLMSKLASICPDEHVRACKDFAYLGVACCEACHTFAPEDELALLELEGGGRAWICCALDRALNPQRHQKFLASVGCGNDEELRTRSLDGSLMMEE
jgi:hypothetical protein